jgi:hypothetical protein
MDEAVLADKSQCVPEGIKLTPVAHAGVKRDGHRLDGFVLMAWKIDGERRFWNLRGIDRLREGRRQLIGPRDRGRVRHLAGASESFQGSINFKIISIQRVE